MNPTTNPIPIPTDPEGGSPAAQALRQVEEVLGIVRRGKRWPVLAAVFGAAALIVLNILLFHHIFLSLFLGIVFVVFLAGQVMAFRQLKGIDKELEDGRDALRLIEDAGDSFDPAELRRRLRAGTPPSEIRNLVLGWLELGLQGRSEGYGTLLEEALERRSIRENRVLSMHDTLNSTTLKLGFLGTLIGIILTFPPMKRAVLGLSDSDGELNFIRDIALAIDGDQYAILSTLIAIGLSILIESITIQFLEGVFRGTGTALSHLSEWNLLVLRPVIAARRDEAARADAAEKNRARLEEAVVDAQAALERRLSVLAVAAQASDERLQGLLRAHEAMAARSARLEEAERNHARLERSVAGAQVELEKHLSALATATLAAHGQLDEVARLQMLMEERMARLAEYERQYRDFLSAKSKAVAPEGARGGA